MAGLFIVVAAFASMIAFMFLAYHRMIGIRDGSNSRLETDPDPLPSSAPYIDEVRGEDGLVIARPMTFDVSLSSADKRAAELPDVNQTLQGKR